MPDRLSDAVNYIEELQARVEKLKDRKESLLEHQNLNTASCPLGKTSAGASLLPEIMTQEMGSALEVVIISSKLGCQLTFNEVVRVLHEEGAEIVGANFSVMGDIAFHCIHSEVRPRVLLLQTIRSRSHFF